MILLLPKFLLPTPGAFLDAKPMRFARPGWELFFAIPASFSFNQS